jgi:hypothetical protein
MRIARAGRGAVQPHDASLPARVQTKDLNMTIIHLGPLISLIAGILILIMPRLLNYIVAIYLIIIGIIGLFGSRL